MSDDNGNIIVNALDWLKREVMNGACIEEYQFNDRTYTDRAPVPLLTPQPVGLKAGSLQAAVANVKAWLRHQLPAINIVG